MTTRLPFAVRLGTIIACVSAGPVYAGGQAPARATGTRPVATELKQLPRTSDGRPDLEGTWDFKTLTPLERPAAFAGRDTMTDAEKAEIEQRAAAGDGPARRYAEGSPTGSYNQFWYDVGDKLDGHRTSLITDPPDGRIPPLTPEGQRKTDDATATRNRRTKGASSPGRATDDPEAGSVMDRCIMMWNEGPPMTPGPHSNFVQIVQTRDYLVIFNEMIHAARIIPTDGRPHLNLRLWKGASRGRWEGDTFVIETKNFLPPGTGTHDFTADENMHLIERLTRIDADTLKYEFTINDPTMWTRSWTAAFPMEKTDALLYEYACHEGNYAMQHMLEAARAQEAK